MNTRTKKRLSTNSSEVVKRNLEIIKKAYCNGKKVYKCSGCCYTTTNSENLKRHMFIHNNVRPYKCDHCNFAATQASHLKIHMLCHTGEKPYQCSKCDYKARQSSHLNQHMLIHTNEKPFQCPKCDYSSRQPGQMRLHMKNHAEKKYSMCSLCSYTPHKSRDSNVRKNLLLSHKCGRKFACTECNYKTRYATNLSRHNLIHQNFLPYPCSKCDYKARQKGILIKHLKKHDREEKLQAKYNLTTESNPKKKEKPQTCRIIPRVDLKKIKKLSPSVNSIFENKKLKSLPISRKQIMKKKIIPQSSPFTNPHEFKEKKKHNRTLTSTNNLKKLMVSLSVENIRETGFDINRKFSPKIVNGLHDSVLKIHSESYSDMDLKEETIQIHSSHIEASSDECQICASGFSDLKILMKHSKVCTAKKKMGQDNTC